MGYIRLKIHWKIEGATMIKTLSGVRVDAKKRSKACRASAKQNTGFVGESTVVCSVEHGGNDGAKLETPTPVPAGWVTSELMEKTRTLWEKRYGRVLERGEVMEILDNVRRFGELLRRQRKGETL